MVEAVVGCKWAVGLLAQISDGTTRPSSLQRALPGLSAKVMNERLSKMTRFGILQRTALGEKPPLEVHYRLTALGVRFTALLDEVRRLQADLDQGALGREESEE